MLEHAGVVPTAARRKQCFCPASRARTDEPTCSSLTQGYQINQRYCCEMRCQSPWRLCIRCIAQGHTGEDAQTTDPKTGWCTFHTARGANAVRPKGYHQSRAGYSETYPMADGIPREYRIPDSSGPTGGQIHFNYIGSGHSSLQLVAPAIIPVDIQDVANKIKKLPLDQPRQLAMRLGTCPTKTMEEIAQELQIKRNSLDCLFRRLYNYLGMPGRQYTVAEKREVVYRAWQLAYPAE